MSPAEQYAAMDDTMCMSVVSAEEKAAVAAICVPQHERAIVNFNAKAYAQQQAEADAKRATADKAIAALSRVDADYTSVEQLRLMVVRLSSITRDMAADSEMAQCWAALAHLDNAFLALEV